MGREAEEEEGKRAEVGLEQSLIQSGLIKPVEEVIGTFGLISFLASRTIERPEKMVWSLMSVLWL